MTSRGLQIAKVTLHAARRAAIQLLCPLLLVWLVASAAFAAPHKPKPIQPPWMVADAPYRIHVRLGTASELPEAGIVINIPGCNLTRPDLADVILTDRDGVPQPLAKIASRPGSRILLLAQKLEPEVPYFLYFGGGQVRTSPEWTPKVSLLMETRPAPADLKFDSLQSLKTAWNLSPEAPGAGFVSLIYHGGNPFGPNTRFLTRYTGYLRVPKAKEITFYTLSSDCSFVVINDQHQFGWPGQHSPHADPNTVTKKTIPCPEGLVKVEYWAAKGEAPLMGRLEAASVLGWQTDTGFETIPTEAWLHPGAANVGPIQRANGQLVPMPKVNTESYIGYGLSLIHI